MTPDRPTVAARAARRARRARLALPLLALAAAAAIAAACSETGTDPDAPVSIAFDSLPAPAVAAGDTLRDDSTGVVMPLRALAFNGRNQVVPNAPFTYFVRDTGSALRIASGNYVVAGPTSRKDSVGIVATLGVLQLTRGIFVVPKPDTLRAADDSVKTLALGDSARTSEEVAARVVHDSLGADTVPVRGWVVFFSVVSAGTSLADSVRLVDAAGSAKASATSDADGRAAIRVRVFPKKVTRPADTTFVFHDSVVVSAVARYQGKDVPAGGIRLALPLIK
ncbi:MAG: hypothetical protein ACJ79S_16400 [Gemmatimonadaceae bacterium]